MQTLGDMSRLWWPFLRLKSNQNFSQLIKRMYLRQVNMTRRRSNTWVSSGLQKRQLSPPPTTQGMGFAS